VEINKPRAENRMSNCESRHLKTAAEDNKSLMHRMQPKARQTMVEKLTTHRCWCRSGCGSLQEATEARANSNKHRKGDVSVICDLGD
jgi:hypothetical protein